MNLVQVSKMSGTGAETITTDNRPSMEPFRITLGGRVIVGDYPIDYRSKSESESAPRSTLQAIVEWFETTLQSRSRRTSRSNVAV